MIFIFVFGGGLIFGSFANVLIWRLKSGEKIVNSRSRCPHCRKQLKAIDLIPIGSFIFLRGRCRYCRQKISWQYPLVELVIGALFVLAFWVELRKLGSENDWQFILTVLRDWFFMVILVAIFVYDLKWYQILDQLTLPAIIGAVIFILFLKMSWLNLLLAGIFGLAFFFIQWAVSKGKWIGDGDLRLGFLMGVMLGWPNVAVAIFLAYIIGAIFSIGLLLRGVKKLKSQIPFGTFLSLATIIALFWGSDIVNWYLSLL